MSSMSEADNELQQRVCRACSRGYAYPVLHSQATRFYCADCAALPPGVRDTFELINKRMKKLSATVEKLEKKLTARASAEDIP